MHSTSKTKTIAAFVLSSAQWWNSTGAAVPSAAVAVKNTDTNLQLKLVTSSTGSYQAPNLPIGNYSVSFSKDGFKPDPDWRRWPGRLQVPPS